MTLKKKFTERLRLFLLGCLSFLWLSGTFAQGNSQTIRGTVVDASTREPLIGVSIQETGTNNGAVSDVNGNYTLRIGSNSSTVKFSYIGYSDVVMPASRATGTITMKEDDKTLSEVVVVGYGSRGCHRRRQTGSQAFERRPLGHAGRTAGRGRAAQQR